MKKSKIVTLVLVSSLFVTSCQPEPEDQLYMRGSEEDDYSAAETNYTHGFHPYYYISRDFSNNTYSARRGGYESSSINPNSVRKTSAGRYFGYGGARVSRGGFGSTGSHGFGG